MSTIFFFSAVLVVVFSFVFQVSYLLLIAVAASVNAVCVAVTIVCIASEVFVASSQFYVSCTLVFQVSFEA